MLSTLFESIDLHQHENKCFLHVVYAIPVLMHSCGLNLWGFLARFPKQGEKKNLHVVNSLFNSCNEFVSVCKLSRNGVNYAKSRAVELQCLYGYTVECSGYLDPWAKTKSKCKHEPLNHLFNTNSISSTLDEIPFLYFFFPVCCISLQWTKEFYECVFQSYTTLSQCFLSIKRETEPKGKRTNRISFALIKEAFILSSKSIRCENILACENISNSSV